MDGLSRHEELGEPLSLVIPFIDRPKVPELVLIYNILEEIAESHRNLRRKTEQKMQRKNVQHEWAKVFSRFDYFFLFIFELLNMAALAVFLRVAWLPTPELREQIL
ncbi:hypothetical protein NECAME_07329 [Necator americanus]|uniref:Neurotransmitter-gated ion-channel transmembrane domain-containing protein n=1 Tax=Necator americanus TaxID=51031 RepID=W2TR22_NECAM|nr:hypothetical protein NECAME_07329 [Necator americanus]ETN83571.1 hypothetical protein NECAME_07329 [Necator americanus]